MCLSKVNNRSSLIKFARLPCESGKAKVPATLTSEVLVTT